MKSEHVYLLSGLVSRLFPFITKAWSEKNQRQLSNDPPQMMKYLRLLDSGTRMNFVSSDRVLLYVNKLYCDWYKAKPEQLIGSKVIDVTGKRGFQQMRPQVERALRGEIVHYQAVLTLPIGRHAVDCSYLPIINPDGTTQGYFGLIREGSR